MCDTRDPPDDLALIEAIAAALREELGVPIEEQPGFHHPDEAGQVNRAFRAMARTILRPGVPAGEDLSAILSDVLRRLARRRLEAGLLDAREVEHLLGLEFDGRDDWLAFLILAPWSEIEFLLRDPRPRQRLKRSPRRDPPHPLPTRSVTTNRRNFMTLAERLSEFVRAAFTGLWIQSFEHDDAIAEIARLCRQQGWNLAAWDIDRGLNLHGRGSDSGTAVSASDPLSAIRSLGTMANPDGTSILVLRNFHKFLNNIEVVQALDSAIAAGKTARTFVVVLSPVVQIPVELERAFVVIEHDLPGRDQLERIARGVATEPGELPEGDGLTAVLDAAAGLTRVEAENAFSLCLVRHNRVAPDVLWELKAQTLKKSGLLTLHRGGETFADLGGLEALKSFCTRALRPGRRSDVRARGVLLLGPPGTGKSACAKALGNETGRPTLFLDVGSLMGSLIGQTEERTRQALEIADAMAPCVILVDELEKALSGVGGTGDSGVSTRMFGTLLTYLSDHESDVFVVASANDISKLPPELSRPNASTACSSWTCPGRPSASRSGRCTSGSSGSTRASAGRTTATGPAPRSGRAAGWRPCWTSRWPRPRPTSSRWP